jgi:hypothetical protein
VLKYPNVGDSVRERTGKREISGILSFVREIPAQNGLHVRFISNRKSFLPCQLQQERGLCLDQAAV